MMGKDFVCLLYQVKNILWDFYLLFLVLLIVTMQLGYDVLC